MRYFSHRTSKYNARRTIVDGISFASKREARRWSELMLIARAGEIVGGIERQKPYSLDINGKHICTYRADFVYHTKDGKRHVEDSKGFKTREYEIKKKLMAAIWGIAIEEV
jgi:hypothetical protein